MLFINGAASSVAENIKKMTIVYQSTDLLYYFVLLQIICNYSSFCGELLVTLVNAVYKFGLRYKK